MKQRVLKLWRKNKANEYYRIWGTPYSMERPLLRDGTCNEWDYFKWDGVFIHYNTEKDLITVYCDNQKWEEETK